MTGPEQRLSAILSVGIEGLDQVRAFEEALSQLPPAMRAIAQQVTASLSGFGDPAMMATRGAEIARQFRVGFEEGLAGLQSATLDTSRQIEQLRSVRVELERTAAGYRALGYEIERVKRGGATEYRLTPPAGAGLPATNLAGFRDVRDGVAIDGGGARQYARLGDAQAAIERSVADRARALERQLQENIGSSAPQQVMEPLRRALAGLEGGLAGITDSAAQTINSVANQIHAVAAITARGQRRTADSVLQRLQAEVDRAEEAGRLSDVSYTSQGQPIPTYTSGATIAPLSAVELRSSDALRAQIRQSAEQQAADANRARLLAMDSQLQASPYQTGNTPELSPEALRTALGPINSERLLRGEPISNTAFNRLTSEQRQALSGSFEQLPDRGRNGRITGGSVDLFGAVQAEQLYRQQLAEFESQLGRGIGLPGRSRPELTSGAFQRPADLVPRPSALLDLLGPQYGQLLAGRGTTVPGPQRPPSYLPVPTALRQEQLDYSQASDDVRPPRVARASTQDIPQAAASAESTIPAFERLRIVVDQLAAHIVSVGGNSTGARTHAQNIGRILSDETFDPAGLQNELRALNRAGAGAGVTGEPRQRLAQLSREVLEASRAIPEFQDYRRQQLGEAASRRGSSAPPMEEGARKMPGGGYGVFGDEHEQILRDYEERARGFGTTPPAGGAGGGRRAGGGFFGGGGGGFFGGGGANGAPEPEPFRYNPNSSTPEHVQARRYAEAGMIKNAGFGGGGAGPGGFDFISGAIDSIGPTLKFFAQIGVAIAVLNLFHKGVHESVQELLHYDLALANLANVLNGTAPHARALGESLAVAATKIGALGSEGVNTGAEGLARFGSQRDGTFATDKRIAEISADVGIKAGRLSGQKPEVALGELATIVQDFGLGADQAPKLLSAAVVASQKTGSSLKDVLDGAAKLADEGPQSGLSPERLIAMIAVANARSGRGGAATAGELARVLAGSGAQNFANALFSVGITPTGKADKDIQQLQEKWTTLGDRQQQQVLTALGGRRGGVLDQLMSPSGANQISDIVKESGARPNAANDAFTRQLDTITGRLDKLKVSFIQLGKDIASSGVFDLFLVGAAALRPLVDLIDTLVRTFSSATGPVGHFAIALGELYLIARSLAGVQKFAFLASAGQFGLNAFGAAGGLLGGTALGAAARTGAGAAGGFFSTAAANAAGMYAGSRFSAAGRAARAASVVDYAAENGLYGDALYADGRVAATVTEQQAAALGRTGGGQVLLEGAGAGAAGAAGISASSLVLPALLAGVTAHGIYRAAGAAFGEDPYDRETKKTKAQTDYLKADERASDLEAKAKKAEKDRDAHGLNELKSYVGLAQNPYDKAIDLDQEAKDARAKANQLKTARDETRYLKPTGELSPDASLFLGLEQPDAVTNAYKQLALRGRDSGHQLGALNEAYDNLSAPWMSQIQQYLGGVIATAPQAGQEHTLLTGDAVGGAGLTLQQELAARRKVVADITERNTLHSVITGEDDNGRPIRARTLVLPMNDDQKDSLGQANLAIAQARLGVAQAQQNQISAQGNLASAQLMPGDSIGADNLAISTAQRQLAVLPANAEQGTRINLQAQVAQAQRQRGIDAIAGQNAVALGQIDPRDNIALANQQALNAQRTLRSVAPGSAEAGQAEQAYKQAQVSALQGRVQLANSISQLHVAPGDVYGQSVEKLKEARTSLRAMLPGTAAYNQALYGITVAQSDLANEASKARSVSASLAGDITDPLLALRNAIREAKEKLARDRGNGSSRQQVQADQLAVKQAQANYAQTAFDRNLSAAGTNYQLGQSAMFANEAGRLSFTQYMAYLTNTRNHLVAIKHRTAEQQRELNEVDQAILAASDTLQGAFNIGTIKLPTPYEVRRAIHGGGDYGNTIANQHSSVANVVTININGGDTQQVLAAVTSVVGGPTPAVGASPRGTRPPKY